MSFRKLVSPHSMGIEIEVFYNKQDLIAEKDRNNVAAYNVYYNENCVGFFQCQSDSSISESYEYVWGRHQSVEFASQPLPPAWLKKEIARLEKKVGLTWFAGSNCGIHIHVNRGWLSTSAARKIADFYSSLSGEDQIALFGRKSNDYCRTGWSKTSRYMAVNITNPTTIELRMFKSGSVAWAQYCVNMAEYLVRNNKHLNIHAAAAFAELMQPKEH